MSNHINIYLLICVFIYSCSFQEKINSTGKSLEIIVVKGKNCLDVDFELFKRNCFIEQKPLVETELYGEKKNMFYLIPILEKDFSKIFSTHKNIVFVNSGVDFLTKKKHNIWAKNQKVYHFSMNKSASNSVKKEQIKKLASIIQEDEIQQRIDIFSKKTPKALNKYMHKNFQNQISLPQGFAVIDSLNEVLNLRKDTKKSTQRILISTFNLEPTINNILLEQNKIAKKYISSTIEGTFVCVEERATLYIDTLQTDNKVAVNIKGLWTMKGDFMGGAFFSSLITNISNQSKTLVTFYLYAPGEKKAQHLMNADAILKSVTYN